jgi:N-acetylmuramoyl-L-alanine amidase
MKIAFVIGHHEKSKGAFSKDLNVSEWDFYNQVAELLESSVEVFQHDPNIKGYSNRIRVTAEKINRGDFDLVIEAHFNAASPQANGVETLYYFNSLKGRQYAQHFSELVHDATGIKIRNNGLKALTNSKDRGYAAVYYPAAPTILIEPFFGSNKGDCKKIQSAANMACIIDNFIAQTQ